MENSEEEKKRPPEGEKSTKRKMKTAGQLELLEKTYLRENYPSEFLRAELSEKLGLTDRQLQMWFCHRRLKDRKIALKKAMKEGVDNKDSPGRDDWSGLPEQRKGGGVGGTGAAVPRIVCEGPSPPHPPPPPPSALVKRYCDPPLGVPAPPPILWHHHHHQQQSSMAELHAISVVEAQLGEPLREDGPLLGIEFDPLPPDAFGRPIVPSAGNPKHGGWQYDSKTYERQDGKSIKSSLATPGMEPGYISSSSGSKRKSSVNSVHMLLPQPGTRALHEYQFLPEQPSARSETYDRTGQSDFYDSPIDSFGTRSSSLPTGGPFSHSSEHLGSGYPFQSHASNVNLLQHGRHGHLFSPSSVEPDGVTVKNSLVNYGADAPLGAHAVLRLENTFISPEKQLYSEEDASRMERKRKSEEARIAKEVEAHEKRIRKELERQDIIRRKKEEQMRRDLEKQDRERRKEEERMLREKQREEERFQREQRRELERREKFLQKENLRAEKMRHKEELRREKEAARIKAANERATARKIARESLELIEDERLELMELAASSKGLPSIVSLDSETLQHLELFRDKLISFPPKSVQLKAPFGFQPWIDSEANIGNLLMAWRFLITFVDVLELWPFTLDEFVQAFHDYDPRLLGEIHIALLKSIIKDIEDVARTPSVGLGASQNSAANPGGGHPQIVEGAYAWGFDIRSWQRHLNPLTWPEVLRQLALSAGFGPRWKKSIPQRPCFRDDNEGHDGMDVVSTLRSGAAAESAAAMMQEKGFSYLRRSRHRLTPGTVKYAAFYVLSLEGSRGLTILEVAEKIQKSGLRDLTTSKTPEASIAAALSRDANLFERTAPSTYCVRPAFRKDPADAEAILQAARERIQMFQNGLSDSEEAEKDTEDNDVERDEDFECDAPEDPEIDEPVNLGTSAGDVDKNNSSPLVSTKDGDLAGDNYQSNENSLMENNTDNEDIEIDESSIGEPWVQGLVEGEYSDLSVEERLHALVALIGVTLEGNSIRVVLEERLEAANALKRQMWAEAQLDKRRMKEEIMSKFQVSPFTIVKAEGTPNGAGVEEGQSPLVGVDNKSNDLPALSQAKQEQILEQEGATNYPNNTLIERNMSMQDLPVGAEISPLQQSAFAAEKSRSQLKAYIGQRAEELYVYRSLPLGQDRRRNRYWQFVTFSGNDPGRGRIFFESTDGRWRLIDSDETFDALLSALDVRGLREAHLHSMLQKIEKSFREATKKSVSGLAMTDLNSVASIADASEAAFFYGNNVEISSPSSIVCGDSPEALEYSKSFKIDLGSSNVEKIDALRRYHEFQKWIWMECFHSSSLCATKYGKKRCFDLFSTCDVCYDLHLSKDKHCRYCHETFESSHRTDTSFNQHINDCEEKRKVDPRWKYCASNSSVPMRVRVLKALLALIEVSLASEALKSFWSEAYRKSWGIKLHGSTSSDDLLQVLMMLEAAVKRDFLSQSFETAKEILGSAGHSYAPDGSFVPGSLTVLPWIPRTTAAVALRLLEFDASISYTMHQRLGAQRDKETEEFVRVPSRFTIAKSTHDFDPMDVADETEYRQDDRLIDSIGRMYMRGRGGRGRGRGRGRSGRGGRGSGGTRSEVSKVSIGHSLKLVQGRGRKGRSRGRGRGRGSRTLRGKQLSRKARDKKGVMLHRFNGEGSVGRAASSSKESSRRSARAVWDVEEASAHAIEENGNSVLQLSESDDNEQASGDEFDEPDSNYNGPYSGRDEVGMLQDSEVEDEDPEDDDVCGNAGASDDDEDDDENDVDDDDDGGGGGDAEDVDDEDVDGDAGDGDDGDDGDDDDDDDDRSGSSPVYYSE